MTMPLVTVAIPTYSRLDFLKEAVASALNQTVENVEVLVSDDGNSRELAEWCIEQQSCNSRFRYQHNSTNLGLAGNWNALASSAKGAYCVIMGDDDRLLPEFSEVLLREAHGADVVFCNHFIIDASGQRLERETAETTRYYARDRLMPGRVTDPESLVWRNSVPMSAALVRTEVLRRLGFKADLNTPEIEMFARLARDGGTFVFTPEYLGEYRSHGASLTSAGLWSQRLVPYMESILVSPEVEPLKRKFMATLLLNAGGESLRRGDRALFSKLSRSSYYPEKTKSLHALIQRSCALLPAAIGSTSYAALQRLKRRWVALRKQHQESRR